MINKQLSISEIISIEWDMFQQVQNIGGRAECQDDPETFQIMRRSQYENWSDAMIESYLDYLRQCLDRGRNLVTEKYARMMEYTDTRYYDEYLAPALPTVPNINYRLVNQIVEQQIAWEQDFVVKYPRLAARSRPVTSEADADGFTSVETYARGELLTHPTSLLQLYLDYVQELKAEGKSLSVMIEDTMVRLYGYNSIEDAEAQA